MMPTVRIETATPNDIPLILRMIKALAEYERLLHLVTATESSLRDAFFGPRAFVEAILAYIDGQAVGFATFFRAFSTFSGTPGLYLEDLFVLPDWRGNGVGAKLLANVAATAVNRGCERINWVVLDWNETAIRFYSDLGAEPVKEWLGYSISGERLIQLAQRSRTRNS